MQKKRTAGILLVIGMIWLLNSTSGKRISSFAGPYRIIVNTLTNVTDDFDSNGKFYVKIFATHPKPRELQYLWGILEFNTEVNDEMKMEIRIATRNNNQWKKNAFVMSFDRACTSLFAQIGRRILENKTWEFTFPTFPVMPYSRYRFTLAVVNKAKQVLGVIVTDVNVVPRI